MRWPVQLQLLLPTLSIVILAIVLASAASAYLGASRARYQQEENLRRVVATLTDATFPLTERVLRQMSGLSRAEFVLLDENHRIRTSTLALRPEELDRLNRLPRSEAKGRFSADPVGTIGGRAYFGNRVPVAPRGSVTSPGFLVVLYPEDRWWAGIRQAAYPALIAGGVAVMAVVLVTTVLAHRFVRPIRQLGVQTAAIANGQFNPVAVPPRDDELRDLAESINQMTEKLSGYESEVRRSERLRTLGQLGAGMAHQLRNAATGAWMAIELHQRQCPEGAGCESLEVAVRQLRLMESYLQRFLTLGRTRSAPPERASLQAVVDDVFGLVRPACRHAGIDLTLRQPDEPLGVWGDVEALRQLLVNLILNGVEAAGRPDAAAPRVTVELLRQSGSRALLRVLDSGPGPAEAARDRLFEPFVTEKPDGTGLGLFVARQIAEAHQGTIGWERRDGMTCFFVDLPLIEESDHGPPPDRRR